MVSIMSNLPNDIIINILKERRIMKQTDRYKKYFNYVLKEIIKFDNKCFRNNKRKNRGKKLLTQVLFYNHTIKLYKQVLIDELSKICNIPFETPSDMLGYIINDNNYDDYDDYDDY